MEIVSIRIDVWETKPDSLSEVQIENIIEAMDEIEWASIANQKLSEKLDEDELKSIRVSVHR